MDPTSTEAWSPRSPLIIRDHRPSDLTLTRTNGFTTIAINELKQRICDCGTDSCNTITQVPRHRSRRLPKTPIVAVMGNKPSSLSGSPEPDNASLRSVMRKPNRLLRKSSTNLFKRIDSKSPLQPELTGTVIQVHQQVSPTTFDSSHNENDESPVDPFKDPKTPSNSHDVVPVSSASSVTITEEDAMQLLTASTTIRESRVDSRRESRLENRSSFVEVLDPDSEDELKQLPPPPPPHRDSALSPSIPAPSPLLEDSPHKYGLKDRMDTPEVPEPEEINVVKVRRRSSGLEIFNVSQPLIAS